jgi:hypothetical protein
VFCEGKMSEERLRKDLHSPSEFIGFKKPRKFSVDEIRKLALSTDINRTHILVSFLPFNDDFSLKVIGLIHSGSSFEKSVVSVHNIGYAYPHLLAFDSVSPGHVSVSIGGNVILTLRDGQLFKFLKSPLLVGPISEYFKSPHEYLASKIIEFKPTVDDKYYDPLKSASFYYRDCINRLLSSILHNNHGSTLLILRQDKNRRIQPKLSNLNIKYKINYHNIWNYLVKLLNIDCKQSRLFWQNFNKKPKPSKPKMNELDIRLDYKHENLRLMIDDAIDFISCLARIDGCVVMTDKFQVLGFGAEVIYSSPIFDFITVTDNCEATHSQEISLDEFGTRHRSAIRFCSSHPDAIAFVFSSDGGMKAITTVNSKLLMWKEPKLAVRWYRESNKDYWLPISHY